MFEALLAEASLVEPSVESGSDGEPGSFDPEVALEVGLPEFPPELEFAGLLDDQSAAEAGTDIAGEDPVLELDTEPGSQAARQPGSQAGTSEHRGRPLAGSSYTRIFPPFGREAGSG